MYNLKHMTNDGRKVVMVSYTTKTQHEDSVQHCGNLFALICGTVGNRANGNNKIRFPSSLHRFPCFLEMCLNSNVCVCYAFRSFGISSTRVSAILFRLFIKLM